MRKAQSLPFRDSQKGSQLVILQVWFDLSFLVTLTDASPLTHPQSLSPSHPLIPRSKTSAFSLSSLSSFDGCRVAQQPTYLMDKGETKDGVCNRKNGFYILRGHYEYSNLHVTVTHVFTKDVSF